MGCIHGNATNTSQTNQSDSSTPCIQVIAYAANNQIGECRQFPTPCDVPAGWTQVDSCWLFFFSF